MRRVRFGQQQPINRINLSSKIFFPSNIQDRIQAIFLAIESDCTEALYTFNVHSLSIDMLRDFAKVAKETKKIKSFALLHQIILESK